MKRTEENTAAQGAAQPRFLISLRWSASLVAAVLVAAATLALGTITRDDTRKALNEEARLKLVLNTRDMAISCTDALLSDFPELTLVPLAKDLLRDRTEITDVVVLNHQQVIKGCADPRQVGNAWRSPDGWTPLAPAGLLNPGEQLSRQGKLLRMDCPIHYSGDMKGHLGSVVMTMDTSYLDGLLKAQMQRQMSVGLVLMGVAFVVTALLMSLLFRSLSPLREGLGRIGQGDLDSPIRVRDFSELGMLASSVNEMAGQLSASRRLAKAQEQEVLDTQKEIIHTLGEVVEGRSSETANHTIRVGELSYELALLAGLSRDEAELLRAAAPMHDVGKIGIPDSILNKPGKLTDFEYRMMQAHPEIGYRILNKSERPLIKAAAIIAHQHHERWDGKGYPRGIAGVDIHPFGRIVALADVFDALFSDRVYRKAMPLEKVLGIIQEGRGSHFEARLVDLFMENLKIFLGIIERYQDAPMDDSPPDLMDLTQEVQSTRVNNV